MTCHTNFFRYFFSITFLLSLTTSNAPASYLSIDNFDSLLPGELTDQNGWTGSSGIGEVTTDPDGSSNQVLTVSTDSGVLRRPTLLPDAITGTLFLRFRFEQHGRYSFGLSHLNTPSEFSDFGPELGMASASASDPNDDFHVADDSTGTYEVLQTLSADTWYNTWIQVDNATNTYQVWLNGSPGSNANPLSDMLDNDAGLTSFNFRTGGSNDLLSFFIKTGGGSSTVQGSFWLDDIYLDQSGLNLTNPTLIPLPPSALLMLSGGLPLLWYRRRFRPSQKS